MAITKPMRVANSQRNSNGERTRLSGTKRHNWVPILEQALYKPRKLRVVCIGAGYSGLMIAHKVKHETPRDHFIDLAIYEKNADVGGTWLENRYPGVACDVPAHIYTFPFEPNPDWSSFYAPGSEILAYIKKTTKKYNLDEHVAFNSTVLTTVWNEVTGKWRLEINQSGRIIYDEADVLINGSGILNNWRWPDIHGLETFKGKKMHSASWDSSFDVAGKRIALIGNGSSALQILPQIQPKAASVVNYIRSPTWISANYSAELTPEGKNFEYTESQKQDFRDKPHTLTELRRDIEHSFNQFFYTILVDSPQQRAAERSLRRLMEERLNHNPELCSKLIPDWRVGCRRLSPGEGYLEALQMPNVRAEFATIEAITESGIKTEKGTDEFDVIICATGFDVSFTPSWTLIGKDSINLADQWADQPTAYFGVCVPNMPNYFIFNGPNCPVGHGSFLSVMDWTADYILRWCEKIAVEDIKCVTVNEKATADYNVYTQEYMKRTAWASGCRSWYKNHKAQGPVTATYAGSVLHYKEILESFRTEDFDFTFNSSNRFRFMANGLTQTEEKGGHLGYYVRK